MKRLALGVLALLAIAATAVLPAAMGQKNPPGGGGGTGGDVPAKCQRFPEGSPQRRNCIQREQRNPSGGGGGGATTISALKLTPSTFKQANQLERFPITTDPAKGTAVTYNLSAAGRVGFKVFRLVPKAGRKVNGRCVRKTKANKNKPKCTLKVVAGSFPHEGVAGANSFRFTGAVGKGAQKPGKFSLEGSPTSNRASTAKASFKIVK
jgi:hypothetical protein